MKRHSTDIVLEPSRRKCPAPARDSVLLVPVDLLAHALSFIPRYPRLAVLSFVCKRWRSAVLRTIHELHCLGSFDLRLFPNITSLVVLDIQGEITLPPRLQHLTLGRLPHTKRDRDCTSTHFYSCTTLTSLTLTRPCPQHTTSCYSSILCAVTLPLTLQINFTFYPTEHLPSLCDLTIRKYNVANDTQSCELFIAKHASQLTRLSASVLPLGECFPQLKELQFWARVDSDMLPPAARVGLLNSATPSQLQLLQTSLTELVCTPEEDFGPAGLISGLSPFSMLTSLALDFGPPLPLLEALHTLPCAVNLTSLRLWSGLGLGLSVVISLGEFPALTSLNTDVPVTMRACPSLRTLHLMRLPIFVCEHFLYNAPALQTIVYVLSKRVELGELSDFVRKCMDRGVVDLTFSGRQIQGLPKYPWARVVGPARH